MKPITRSHTNRAQLRFQILEKVFNQIEEEQRRLILMDYRGYTADGIAKELDISKPIVTNQLELARQEVKNLIQQYYT